MLVVDLQLIYCQTKARAASFFFQQGTNMSQLGGILYVRIKSLPVRPIIDGTDIYLQWKIKILVETKKTQALQTVFLSFIGMQVFLTDNR